MEHATTAEFPLASDLPDLVLNSPDAEHFLHELTVLAAAELSTPGREVFCGTTVIRHKKNTTVASSDDHAQALDEIQNRFHDGPCLTAARTSEIVHVPELAEDPRWPEYATAGVTAGIGSVLAVPFLAEGDTKAGLNLYSALPHGFSGPDIERAEKFALHANASLCLALRIAHLTETRKNLSAAMESRTAIDLAAGVIMAQNRCSQEAAMTILKSASSSRNIKLRDVAASVVRSVARDTPVATHFDE